MGLGQQITDDLKAAMKARDKNRLSVLRMLQASLKNERIARREDLTDDDVIAVCQREVKKRREAAEQYRKAAAEDRAEAEEAEAVLLSTYLPAALSEAELEAAVDAAIAETGAETKGQMGLVMKEVMAHHRGRVDGKAVQQMVMAKLA